MTHILTPLQPVTASGPGALDGFACRCSCGQVISSSLPQLTRQWAQEHVAYFAAKNGAKV